MSNILSVAILAFFITVWLTKFCSTFLNKIEFNYMNKDI